ncbi:DUF5641 domain-containing protein, partial [Nephila pilipes]
SEVGSESKVRLCGAKNRVASLKPLRFCRLELRAYFIGARLANSVIRTHSTVNIKITLWSDSTAALKWIKEFGEWCTPKQMLDSKWWEGPSWLKENPESWPVSEVIFQPSEVDIQRRKGKTVNMNLREDTVAWYAEKPLIIIK